MNYAKLIDHTLLKADAKKEDIIKLCKEAKDYGFKIVCIQPSYVSLAKEELKDSDVEICTVIGFPLGQNTTSVKVFEAIDAINNGADEIDMVINISKLKDHDDEYVTNEIKAIKKAINNHVLKVIIETCLLTDEEKERACKCVIDAKAEFVKTSTGFSIHGATVEDVKLLKDCVKDKALVKAAGGVRSKDDLIKMVEAGASRIGTSSGTKLVASILE